MYVCSLCLSLAYLNKSSAVAEMSDRDHNKHGPKREEAAVPLSRGSWDPRLTQCGLGRGLLPYQVASSSIHPFGHNRHGPKIGWGLCLFFWGWSWVPIEHKVCMCSYVCGILMHPAVWPRCKWAETWGGGSAPFMGRGP